MEDQCVRNYLFVGASSKIVNYFIRNNNYKNSKYYGVSTKPDIFIADKDIKVCGYNNINEFEDVSFNMIFVLASRLPWEDANFNQYMHVITQVEILLKALTNTNMEYAKMIFLSSLSVYDSNVMIVDESTPVVEKNNYAISKLEMEKMLSKYSEIMNFDILILRIPIFAYPGEGTNFVSRLISATKSKSEFTLTNKNSSLSAIFDIDHLIAIEKTNWSGSVIVNCGAIADITFSQIGDIAIKNGLKKVNWKEGRKPSQVVNIDKISDLLKFAPSAYKTILKMFDYEFSLHSKQ
jgi:nucleoside-diphosphate-sugar epimerase